MLSSKKTKESNQVEAGGFNVINEGTTISGDIKTKGDIRIDGTLIGTVNTSSKLVLGKSGKIEGDLEANCCDIHGKVEGNVFVTDMLFLKTTGRVEGDLSTGKLIVESGGQFNGKCSMGSIKSIAPGNAENANNKKGAVA